MSATSRARGERGGTLVEFAVVAPILFLLVVALADFALAELSDTAGANAAREGARVGIVGYDGAHIGGSPNNVKIVEAVEAKLANNLKGPPVVTVRCLDADGTPLGGGGACSTVGADPVEVGEDLIEVSVTWTRKGGITGFIDPTQTDRSQMRIVGTPPSAVDPPGTSCALTAGSASPAAVVRTGSTIPDVTFRAEVNDAALCGAPLITLPPGSGVGSVQTMLPVSATAFTFTMDGGSGSWTSGTKTATVTANGGTVTRTITFTVNDPDVCLITAAGASPSTVTRSGARIAAPVTFTVEVSDAVVCGPVTLTFPPASGYVGPQAMTGSGNTFTFTMPANQGTWPVRTHSIAVSAAGGGGDSTSISLIVSSPGP